MEQGRREHVGIVDAVGDEPLSDVEAVTTVGDRHRDEERRSGRGQEPPGHRLLLRVDTRAHVSDELTDPMHR